MTALDDSAAYSPRERAYLEERPDEPPFQRFWWNPSDHSPSPRLTHDEVAVIGRKVTQHILQNTEQIFAVSSVKGGTQEITWAVRSALQHLGYECFTEIPFTHELFAGHGRADLIAFAPGSPTIYVEIDSTPVAVTIQQNARKLKAAWMMGALPIWIGWHNFDPAFIETDFPLVKLTVLDRSMGLMKEAAYKRAAKTSLHELARVVDTIVAMSPAEGRCNLPTKTSTLCKREPGHCPHNPIKETLGQRYPEQVLDHARAIVEKLVGHHQDQQSALPNRHDDELPSEDEDGPSVTEAPPEERLPPAYH